MDNDGDVMTTKVFFIVPHSFEPFFPLLRDNVHLFQELDHFSTRYIRFMKKYCPEYSFELFILSATQKKLRTVMHKEGFPIHLFPRDVPLFLPFETSLSLLNGINGRAKKEKGAIWHINSYYLWMSDFILPLLKMHKTRLLIHHRGGGFTLKALPYSLYKYCLMNPLLLRFAKKILVENTDEKHRLITYYHIPSDRIVVAPNPTEIPHPLPSADKARKELHLSPSQQVIMYAGRLEKIKGIVPFFLSFSHLLKQKNLFLLIVGEGSQATKLKEIIAKHGLSNVKLVPWVPKNELFRYYQIADIFVHPNYRSEGLPNTLLEAQGMGIPIVAFDIEGSRDVVVNGISGYLAKPKNFSDFNNKIMTLTEDVSLLQSMKKNAFIHYGQYFAPQKMASLYKNIYQEVMKEP